MSESLPLPHALRFVVEDEEEWRAVEPFLAPGGFPRGMNMWLWSDDLAAKRAAAVIETLEQRLAHALSQGRLSAHGRLRGATHVSVIDGTRCRELEITEEGTGLRLYGLEYESMQFSRRDAAGSVGKHAQRRRLQAQLVGELRPFITILKEQKRQTNFIELRALLEERQFPPFTDSLLRKCAAAAGLSRDLIRRGRPRKSNPSER